MSNETLLTYFQRHVKEHPNEVAWRCKDYRIWHDVSFSVGIERGIGIG
jgi:hypothetical protein